MINMSPGEFVAGYLEESLGIPEGSLNDFLDGKIEINDRVATNLEGLFGNSKEYWLAMQHNHTTNQ